MYHTDGLKPPPMHGEERPRFELASPYGPNLDEVGLDRQFASSALSTVRDGWNEMHEAHPDFFVGLVVGGSLVKGRAHEHSDIDATIFYDPDSPYASSLGGLADQEGQVAHDVQEHIIGHLKDAGFGETFQRRNNIGAFALNARLIDAAITDATAIAERGERLLGRIDLSVLMAPFKFRLGEGRLQEYRAQIVNGLSQSEQGRYIWQLILLNLGQTEEYNRRASIRLPVELGRAATYFHLPQSR